MLMLMSPETRVPATHPLRAIKKLPDEALAKLSPVFEQLDYNLLFRWFLDMDMVEESFVPTVFSHNRDRLIIHDVAGEFLRAIVEQARKARLMSVVHFTVDGTLIESWASLGSVDS